MRFIERVQQDDSVIVQHWSGQHYQGTITNGHRLWTKYQESNNITNIPYVTPAAPVALTDAEKLSAADMAPETLRLAEVLIDTLVIENVIAVTDLPAETQTLYNDRKTLRSI